MQEKLKYNFYLRFFSHFEKSAKKRRNFCFEYIIYIFLCFFRKQTLHLLNLLKITRRAIAQQKSNNFQITARPRQDLLVFHNGLLY